MTPPRALHSTADRGLRGAPFAVYMHIVLYGLLDPVTFSDLKSTPIAREMRMHERTVRWAIRRLVKRGYLEEEERPYRSSPGRFRLVWGGRPLPNSTASLVARATR